MITFFFILQMHGYGMDRPPDTHPQMHPNHNLRGAPPHPTSLYSPMDDSLTCSTLSPTSGSSPNTTTTTLTPLSSLTSPTSVSRFSSHPSSYYQYPGGEDCSGGGGDGGVGYGHTEPPPVAHTEG